MTIGYRGPRRPRAAVVYRRVGGRPLRVALALPQGPREPAGPGRGTWRGEPAGDSELCLALALVSVIQRPDLCGADPQHMLYSPREIRFISPRSRAPTAAHLHPAKTQST